MPASPSLRNVALLDGKKLLITGVLTDDSLAFGVAQLAQREGADVALTGFGRALRLTERTARKLDTPPEIYELDVTDPAHCQAVRESLDKRWGRLDGALHHGPHPCRGYRVPQIRSKSSMPVRLAPTAPAPRCGLHSLT